MRVRLDYAAEKSSDIDVMHCAAVRDRDGVEAYDGKARAEME